MRKSIQLLALCVLISVVALCFARPDLVYPDPAPRIPSRPAPLDLRPLGQLRTATFAVGCFWGPESKFGSMDGVMRTRVGYCGGKTPSPSYQAIGDHSESVQIDFDPTLVSYEQLLKVALSQADFSSENPTRQYRAVIFYHDKSQLEIARKLGIEKLEPVGVFTSAENYHQKYQLRQSPFALDFNVRYPELQDFVNSTAVARANGIAGGHLDSKQLEILIPLLGVSPPTANLMEKTAGTARPGCAVPFKLSIASGR